MRRYDTQISRVEKKAVGKHQDQILDQGEKAKCVSLEDQKKEGKRCFPPIFVCNALMVAGDVAATLQP